jgi:uncharacterized protein YbcI
MAQDTEKVKTPILPVPMERGVGENLLKIQAKLQLKTGKRTSLKKIAADIIKNAKA